MPSPRLILPLSAVVLAVGAAGCIGIDAGPTTTDARDVAPFTRVRADDRVDVTLRTGERRRVIVRTGEKVIDDVHTEVRGGVLDVSYDGPGLRDGRILVEATAPAVDAVEVVGSGDMLLDDIDLDALDVRVTGAGDVSANGRVDRLTLDVSGAGDAELRDLAARSARVEVSGSGDADVHAARELDAEVRGAGDVVYRGDPVVRQDISGAGEVEHVG
jgi:hypothetical protein